MMYLVIGGSGSGKSKLAEDIAVIKGGAWIYAATMLIQDEEGLQKVLRHQNMRRKKGFVTVEAPCNLYETILQQQVLHNQSQSILLECLSNLLANEMFSGQFQPKVKEKIMDEILNLSKLVKHIVIVSNDVFTDSGSYDLATREYLCNLGWINQNLAEYCDCVIESVYSIPYVYKRGGYLC